LKSPPEVSPIPSQPVTLATPHLFPSASLLPSQLLRQKLLHAGGEGEGETKVALIYREDLVKKATSESLPSV